LLLLWRNFDTIIVAVDLDDVLNNITEKMCLEFGCEFRTLDQILKGSNPEGFDDFRKVFLSRESTWELPPTQFAIDMLDYLNSHNEVKTVILTKTVTLKGFEWIAEKKVKFRNKYFPKTDMFIVAGDKSYFKSDILIDDLEGNCKKHEKVNNSITLTYEHGKTTLADIKAVVEKAIELSKTK